MLIKMRVQLLVAHYDGFIMKLEEGIEAITHDGT